MIGYLKRKRKTKMDIQKKLYWLIQAGVYRFCNEKTTQIPVSEQKESALKERSAVDVALQQATTAKNLSDLNQQKQAFSLSSLKKTAAHTLLGIGTARPKLMCVLEMPDTDADRTGDPLIGAQATQLVKMMTAIQLDIEKEVYITYLSPWRTPGNRPLTLSERSLFLPFLIQEIQLVHPKLILLFGAGLAKALLAQESLAKARGIWHTWQSIPCRVTLALAALKTTPLRQQAWTDLQEVQKKLSTF